MLSVPINEPELRSIDYIRIALSEPTPELREKAIANAKHELVAFRLEALSKGLGDGWMSEPQNAEFVQWIAKTSGERFEASYEFSQTAKRYDEHNDVKLSVAEQIGKLIWLSIQDKKFEGVQTDEGILKQVRYQALESGLRGAKDLDVLRGTWKTYRGVVHLGMAIDYCEDNPNQAQNVLSVAENFRLNLSHFCPKGTKKPYVPETDQIKFCYSSNTSGPRLLDRGLPYDVS
jgi:hypothetical protein